MDTNLDKHRRRYHEPVQVIDDSIVCRAFEKARNMLEADAAMKLPEIEAYAMNDFDFEMITRLRGYGNRDAFTELVRKDKDSEVESVFILIRKSVLIKDKEKFYKVLVDEAVDIILWLISAFQKQSDCKSDCKHKYWT